MIAVAEKPSKPKIDETGNRYGRLTVLEYLGPGTYRRAQWLCICDCGNKKKAYGHNLRKGRNKSCGCLNKEISWHRLPLGEGAFNYLCNRLKRNAKERGYEFDLTKEQVRAVVTQNCHYCGSLPTQVTKYRRCNGSFTYNGIDRVDNSRGYVESNVVPCCGRCNRAKDTMDVEEFKVWVVQIYKHFIERDAQ